MLREGMFEERVTKGIRLLDKRHPQWYNKIDWVALDMQEPRECILGQLYADLGLHGGFNSGTSALGIIGQADLYGFDLSPAEYFSECPISEYFWELKREWKRQAQG